MATSQNIHRDGSGHRAANRHRRCSSNKPWSITNAESNKGQIVGGIFDGAVSHGLERGTIVTEFEDLGAGDLAQGEVIAEVARFEGKGSEGNLVQSVVM